MDYHSRNNQWLPQLQRMEIICVLCLNEMDMGCYTGFKSPNGRNVTKRAILDISSIISG